MLMQSYTLPANRFRRPGNAKTRTVTLRLPEQDLARAKEIAKREGIKYQPLLKSLLHDALRRYGS
jgi:predicted DNA binding CopG/RHH family protein